MKKRLSLILCVVLLCQLLSGCGKTTETVREPDDAYRCYYEIFVGSFCDSDGDKCGDLSGITEKLDYIEDMGFTGIWLTPIMPSPTYHKYDATDYYGIDPSFGTMEDFETLLKECHKRNIRLIMDLVFNHTSSSHPWFLEACDYLEQLGEKEPDENECKYVNYYNFAKDQAQTPNWYQIGSSDWYYEGVFWDGMPDLNLNSEAVREELEQVASFWLEKGADGFRLDAAKEYFTGYAEKNIEVLNWFETYVKSVKPEAYLVAEVWEGQGMLQEYYKSGIDSLFNFPASQQDGAIIKTAKARVTPQQFFSWMVKQQTADRLANPDYIDAPFISNHDTTRISAQCVNNEEQMKFAAGLMMMMPGSPFVYYGEELGMKSSGTKDENKRLPMYWSAQDLSKTPDAPQAADAVEQKFPSAEEQEKDPGSILQYYKNAIELRRSNPEIARGSISVPDGELPEDTGVLLTEWEGKVSVILCNNATESVEIDLQQALPEGYNYTLKGSLNVGDQQEKLENNKLELPAYGIVILKQSGVD